MTKALISELRGVIAAHDDDPITAKRASVRKAWRKYDNTQRATLLAKCGLTKTQLARGVELGLVRVEVDPAYLAKCKANQAKRGEQ